MGYKTTQKQQVQSTGSKSHLSVEEVYDKEELATKLVVKDHNADVYRVFYSRKKFWKFHDNVTEHLRSFSKVVYGDLPQFPRIHVEFGSLNRLPGTKIVSLLKQIIDGMLEVFRNRYSGIMNVPNLPNDFVVINEYGQNRHGYWTNDFHIQATSFAFADYKEAKEFTLHVRSSLPVEVGRFISLQYNDSIQLVPILGSTYPKESLHKKISHFSQFLGTNVNIHKNELFVKKFLGLECNAHPTPIADCNTLNECVPSSLSNKHGITDDVDYHDEISYHGNDLAIQQRASSFVEQELQDENFHGDKQTDIIHSGEATITILSAKKPLPPIGNEYAVAVSCLVLLFFIANKIKQNDTRQILSGTHITKSKSSQKRNNDMLKGQRHQRQHNGSARTGKKLGQRNSNCWKHWKFHNTPYI